MRITLLRHFRYRLGLATMLGAASLGCDAFPTRETRVATFTSEPSGATVFVDGVEQGSTPLSRPLSVAAAHHVVMTLPGQELQLVVVPPGKDQNFHVDFRPAIERPHHHRGFIEGRPLVLSDGMCALPPVDDPGNAWLHSAAQEHASVASFARAALELMNVGAPSELIADYHRAALDEVEHTRLSLALASKRAGRTLTLGAMPVEGPREPTLLRVALDTFAEGCVEETRSALHAVSRTRDCDDDERPVWKRIARDETRHAELAWRTLGWAVTRGDDALRTTLQAHISTTRTDDEVWTHVIHPSAARLLSV